MSAVPSRRDQPSPKASALSYCCGKLEELMTIRPEDVVPLIEIQNSSFRRAGPGLRRSWPPSQAMNATELARFLSSKRYAVMATTRPDKRPHIAPVGFLLLDGVFWFASVTGARLDNLKHIPYASIVVMEGEDEGHQAFLAEGPATPQRPRSDLDDLWEVRFQARPEWAAAFIEMKPERVLSYSALSGEAP